MFIDFASINSKMIKIHFTFVLVDGLQQLVNYLELGFQKSHEAVCGCGLFSSSSRQIPWMKGTRLVGLGGRRFQLSHLTSFIFYVYIFSSKMGNWDNILYFTFPEQDIIRPWKDFSFVDKKLHLKMFLFQPDSPEKPVYEINFQLE